MMKVSPFAGKPKSGWQGQLPMCRIAQILLNHRNIVGSSRETPIAEIAYQGEQHATI
jgi:hypothetical protein